MTRTAWLDLSSGASGDMLLGALVGAGVPLDVVREALSPLGLPIVLREESVRRAGLAATRVHVETPDSDVHRRWADVRELLDRLPSAELRERSTAVFAALARAEAAVHGIDVDEVHFHEVGALDAIADVIGTCAALLHLAPDRLVVGPVALGSGSVRTEHGLLPLPGPAVLELLRSSGAPTLGAAGADTELCTPTGAALATTLATAFGTMPPMTVGAVGVGAGGRDPADRANVVRLVVGEDDTAAASVPRSEPALVLEANVDDLDPRVWPEVVATLMAAGAADAWLTPLVMKKGRPAVQLAVLAAHDDVGRLRELVYRHTSTLGVREYPVTKRPLDRDVSHVLVEGCRVAVKRGFLGGAVVTVQPEWEDVAAAAHTLGLPAGEVLARASAAARHLG